MGTLLRVLLFLGVGIHLWLIGLWNLTPTITLEEAEWSLTALVGVIYSADFLREALRNVQVANGADEATRLWAEAVVLIGMLLAAFHLMLLGFGLLSMATPPPLHQANLLLARNLGVGFTLMAVLMVMTLAAIRRRTHRIAVLVNADSAIVGASR